MIEHESTHNFDVAILGSGFSGSMMAAVLAKQGVSVVLIDGETHPRFAVGESTIPHTSLLISLLAEKYGVPEIEHVAYPNRLADKVCTTCGIKLSFGFAYQREGKIHDVREGIQIGTSSKDENHWFRQDTDSYLYHLAVHYGAVPRQKMKVMALEINREGVKLQTSSGEEIRTRYIVDGTGHKSIVADRFGLRENPTRLKHRSRSMFTHMVDVPPFDEARNPMAISWHKGTLHHCFERGWFWVIPFNNHARSTNPLISVGLTVDPRRYAKPEIAAEREFQDFLQRFPSVAEQFANARAVRPWVSTDRLQYSSKQTTGYRYCLMSHAAGFVDPLFSRGMVNTMEVIQAVLDPLLNALATDDFDEYAFAGVDRMQQQVLNYNDNLVNGSFIAWKDFDVWNAWLRVFGLGTFLAEFRLMNALAEYSRTHDPKSLVGEAKNPVFSEFEDPDYAAFFARCVEVIEDFDAGRIPATDAAKRIFDMTGEYEFPVLIRRDALVRADWIKEEDHMTEKNLRHVRSGFRWALTNPTTHDVVSTSETFFRWCARRPDPHLVDTAQAVTAQAS